MTEYVNQCGRCGSGIHYTDCIDCDGTGSPDPHDPEGWCPECEGDGFIAFCISSQDWCYANPLPGHEHTPRNTVIGVQVGPDGYGPDARPILADLPVQGEPGA
jgi:hypothetical protein